MTADDEGRVGGLPKMKSFFTTIFGGRGVKMEIFG